VRRRYIDWTYGQIHLRSTGEGETIVLLGGAPRSGGQFDPVAASLAERGFHVVTPDMPGFGQSDAPPPGIGMAGIAAFLPALLDDLGIGRAHLFGLHSGAKLATAATIAMPDRVASLLVAGKSHSLVPDIAARNAAMLAVVDDRYFANGADAVDGPLALRGWAALGRTLARTWWDDALFTSSEPEAVIRSIEDKIIDDLQSRRSVRDFYAANLAFDFAAALAKVRAPLLVLEITSEAEDRSLGRQAQALAGSLSGAQTAVLPQTDATGLFFHAGVAPLADAIAAFAAAHRSNDASGAGAATAINPESERIL
jgi:pimeloyl-ACP methyl ester carboxylesterase